MTSSASSLNVYLVLHSFAQTAKYRWIHFAWWGVRCPAVEGRTCCCRSDTTLLLDWSRSVNTLQTQLRAGFHGSHWGAAAELAFSGGGDIMTGTGQRKTMVMCCPLTRNTDIYCKSTVGKQAVRAS